MWRATKSPPQVETEISRTRFHVRRMRQPHDGFFVPHTTYYHTLQLPVGVRQSFNC